MLFWLLKFNHEIQNRKLQKLLSKLFKFKYSVHDPPMNNCILSLLAAQFFIIQTNVTVVNLATNRLRSIGSLNRYLSISLWYILIIRGHE